MERILKPHWNLKLWGLYLLAASSAVFTIVGTGMAMAQGPYHITAQWKIGGDGGWDYLAVDPMSKLLYVTRGSHVLVLDTASGKVAADITGLKGTHGVAFDTSGKFGYISDGGANEVVVFDRKTNSILQRVPAGTNPDGIVFEPVTQTVWAFNGRSKSATVIDDSSHQIVATVPLPGKPEFPVADGKGSIYDNIEDLSQIVHIDAKTHKVLASWPIAPCEGPSGLAIDRKHRRLFAVCDGKMAVVDANTGKVVAIPTIGDGPDAARFDPRHQLAFSSNGEGTLSVVHEDSPNAYTVLQTLPTQRGARTMELDEASGKIYVVTADFGPRPAATADRPRPRPSILPGSFVVMVIGR
ncbi:MAG TPA: YncE family protein [Acidobacteriaceae bacterium]|nr:YncE family protein [Acidobacteriaceae bacterium]